MDSIIDTDWCLTCIKRTAAGRVYCSRECKLLDNDNVFSSSSSEDDLSMHDVDVPQCWPSSSSCSSHLSAHIKSSFVDEDALLALQLEWPGYNDDGIRAWARAVPPGCGSPASYCPDATRSSSKSRPNFPLSRQRPAQPALCTNATTQPSLVAPSSRAASPVDTRCHRPRLQASRSASSLVSSLTESIATPVSPRQRSADVSPTRELRSGKHHFFDGLASRFRALVPSPAPPQQTFVPPQVSATTESCVDTKLHSSRTSSAWRQAEPSVTHVAKCERSHDDSLGFSNGGGALSDAELFDSLDGFKLDKWIAPYCSEDICLHGSTGCWEKAGHNPDLMRSLHSRDVVEERNAYRLRGRRIKRS